MTLYNGYCSVKNEANKTFENFNLTNVSWITSPSTEEIFPYLFKNRWTLFAKEIKKLKIKKFREFLEAM